MKTTLQLCMALLCLITGISAQGQITFQKTYGGSADEKAISIQQTNDNGFVMAGRTTSFGAGQSDAYLLKTSSDGSMQWTKTYGTSNFDSGESIRLTADGGFIICGMTKPQASGNDINIYLVKIGSDGSVQWSAAYGGTGDDGGRTAHQTADGGFIIGGHAKSGFGAGNTDMYLVKTASDGTMQWGKTFGGTAADYGYDAVQTADGGYILGGHTNSFGAGVSDMCLVKTDSDGNTQWQKSYGGTGQDFGQCVRQTSDGGFVQFGYTSSFGAGNADLYLVKTASDGTQQWAKTYGGSGADLGLSVQQTADGGFIMEGFSGSSFGPIQNKFYMVKTAADGSVQWSKTVGTVTADQGYSIQQTNDGGYAMCGFKSKGGGDNEFYLIKTDGSGSSNCNETIVTTIAGSGGTEGTGGSQGAGGVQSSPVTQTGTGGTETTLCTTVEINEISAANQLSIYPNPFSSQTTLTVNYSLTDATLTVSNCFGQIVRQLKNISGQAVTFSRDDLASGLYFVQITHDGNILAADKLVITDK